MTLNRDSNRSRPNIPEEDALILAMQAVSRFLDEIIDLHNEAEPDGNCQCDLCYDLAGFRWTLESAESIISSETKPVPKLSISSARRFVELLAQIESIVADEPFFINGG